jgi:hypothetical protein
MAQSKLIFAIILVTVLLFVGGFLIGYFTGPDNGSDSDDEQKRSETSRFKTHNKLYEVLDAERIRKYLR